ncbi:MAG: hypothetical protein RIT14_2653 [Pseudomonadota bacterium]|jgi:hypothetical protein
MTYYLTFRAKGEVAEMLVLNGPQPRLLVDLSVEPLPDDPARRFHTARASFTITDPDLMRRFLAEMKLGDVAEAEGTFLQSDYVPHRTTCIDTTFEMRDFRKVDRPLPVEAEPEEETLQIADARPVSIHIPVGARLH